MVQAVVADVEPAQTEVEFVFAQLVSRSLDSSIVSSSIVSTRVYHYTVLGVDGRSLVVDKGTATTYPLKANGEEPYWDCACCSARSWSVERALLCLTCGAPTPVDETRLAQQRQAKRASMASERPSELAGRRIVMEVQPFKGKGRAKGVYSMATEAATLEAAIAAEVDEDAAKGSAWAARRFDSLIHLDGAVSMLTLGNQGIMRETARGSLQPAAVAAALTLAPRLVQPADDAEAEHGDGEDVTAAQAALMAESDSGVNAARLLRQHAAAVIQTDLAPAGAGLACSPCGCEEDIEAGQDGSRSGPTKVPVLPRVRADRQALGELPGLRAAEFEAQLRGVTGRDSHYAMCLVPCTLYLVHCPLAGRQAEALTTPCTVYPVPRHSTLYLDLYPVPVPCTLLSASARSHLHVQPLSFRHALSAHTHLFMCCVWYRYARRVSSPSLSFWTSTDGSTSIATTPTCSAESKASRSRGMPTVQSAGLLVAART